MIVRLWLLALIFLVSFAGCSSSSTVDDTDSDTTGLQFISVADFASSASASFNALIKTVTTAQCADVDSDDQFHPDLEDGLDCDGDGGVVAHITPSLTVE